MISPKKLRSAQSVCRIVQEGVRQTRLQQYRPCSFKSTTNYLLFCSVRLRPLRRNDNS